MPRRRTRPAPATTCPHSAALSATALSCRPPVDRVDTCWLATREGEPSFGGVVGLGDAISVSSTRGDVAIARELETGGLLSCSAAE